MISNVKALGLMAVAALAMSAMLTSAAQAETGNGVLTAGETPETHTAAELVGGQFGSIEENYLEVTTPPESSVHCKNEGVKYAGEASGTDTEIEIEASYEECTDNNGRPVTVTMNGCKYLLTQPKTAANEIDYTGTVDIVCPAEKVIEVHVYDATHTFSLCTITIGSQNNLNHVVYENTSVTKEETEATGKHDDIDVTIKIENQINYTVHGFCVAETQFVENGGSFFSNLTVSSPEHDIWMSD